MTLLSFLICLAGFLGVGLWASSRHTQTTEDYLLASRNINPWLAGLSASATEKSGFTFIGYVGVAYLYGLSSVWLYLGLYTAYFLYFPRITGQIKALSDTHNLQSYTDLLNPYTDAKFKALPVLVGLLTLIFLGIYAAAQLTAGSKALHVLFGWHEITGTLIGAIILCLYSYKGGIRASIWTDSVQMITMIFSIGILLIAGINAIGGFDTMWQQLTQIDPEYTRLIPSIAEPTILLWLGWTFGGVGVSGQPHIMVRFMALNTQKNNSTAFFAFILSNTIFVALITLAAMSARLLIDNTGDPELTLPLYAMEYLPEAFTGLLLAGLFASTMSTADSQVLSCSAALSQSIIPKWRGVYNRAKLSTLIVIIAITTIAIFSSKSVFTLVAVAWGALAAGFSPLLLFKISGDDPDEFTSIVTILAGLFTALIWRFCGLSATLFETVPGMSVGIATYLILSHIRKRKHT